LADGTEVTSRLGHVAIVQPDPPPPLPAAVRVDDALIVICMATFEPDPRLFRAPVESLRAQTDPRWVCLISDDSSSPEQFEQIRQTVGNDPRFLLSRSDERLGFYRNFERALRMVPPEARLVAMCDQDDRWHPEKLETLRAALGGAVLAYSDQRLVDADGRVLRTTLWKGRRNNSRNVASQLVSNTITGAATLFRRELLHVALPFPDGPGFLFHDHWIGLAAMATGRLAFVDRPLYDYVQHPGAVFGDVALGDRGASTRRPWRQRLKPRRGQFDRWRAAYFYGYLSRALQAQTLLVRSPERLSARDRRTLERFVACGDSPTALAWLALRPLRSAFGFNETLGSEAGLEEGIIWRRLVGVRASRSRARYDSGLPDPAVFEQAGLRRWRARL
jgi:glycosyltransferase involved in cell wall biosynthesis